MDGPRPLRRTIDTAAGILFVLSFAPFALSQNSNIGPAIPAPGNEIHSTSANAASYLDFPLLKLQQKVPALHGLAPDPVQDRLAFILTRTGTVIADLSPKLPNLVSREDVHVYSTASVSPDSSLDPKMLLGQSPSKEFNYLILPQHNPDGSTTIDEYRADLKNRRIELSEQRPGFPRYYGFANEWLLFSPANQLDARFRYLGRQKMEGHKTFVVGFAQNPDRVKSPGSFMSEGKTIPFLVQGVAWIDQSTFRIVMVHMDLLAPLVEVQLTRMTTELNFRLVRLRELGADLWLPREVFISSEQQNQIVLELHQYSDYRLYRARSRIVLTP